MDNQNEIHPIESFGVEMIQMASAMYACHNAIDDRETRIAFAHEIEAVTDHLKIMGNLLYKYCEGKEHEQEQRD